MQSNSTMIHKLQSAINSKGYRILYNKTQFYSDKQDRPVTMYTIKQVVDSQDVVTRGKQKKNTTIELFKSCSQIQIVFFLRDFWYEINGWEVPTDNEQWNVAKQKYYDKQGSEEESMKCQKTSRAKSQKNG